MRPPRPAPSLGSFLLFAAAGRLAAWTHGVFPSEHTRQIAHRWRPIVHPLAENDDPDGPLALLDRDKVRRYTRAMVALQHAREGRTPFGTLCEHEDAVCLYVMHAVPHRKHVVHAVLWWSREDEDFCRLAAEQLWVWHRREFPGVDLAVSSAMEERDRAIFRDAWGSSSI